MTGVEDSSPVGDFSTPQLLRHAVSLQYQRGTAFHRWADGYSSFLLTENVSTFDALTSQVVSDMQKISARMRDIIAQCRDREKGEGHKAMSAILGTLLARLQNSERERYAATVDRQRLCVRHHLESLQQLSASDYTDATEQVVQRRKHLLEQAGLDSTVVPSNPGGPPLRYAAHSTGCPWRLRAEMFLQQAQMARKVRHAVDPTATSATPSVDEPPRTLVTAERRIIADDVAHLERQLLMSAKSNNRSTHVIGDSDDESDPDRKSGVSCTDSGHKVEVQCCKFAEELQRIDKKLAVATKAVQEVGEELQCMVVELEAEL